MELIETATSRERNQTDECTLRITEKERIFGG
ncbi:hypothetical protein SATMO3_18840 [Sporomusa aerivorans]